MAVFIVIERFDPCLHFELKYICFLTESVPGSARDLQGVSGDTAHLSEGTAQPEGGRSIQYITHNPHPFPNSPNE